MCHSPGGLKLYQYRDSYFSFLLGQNIWQKAAETWRGFLGLTVCLWEQPVIVEEAGQQERETGLSRVYHQEAEG